MGRITDAQLVDLITRRNLEPTNPKFLSCEHFQAFLEGRLVLKQEAMKDSSGGVARNSIWDRVNQTKRLWNLGFGRELGKKSFEEYVADIPEIPESLKPYDPEFPLLTLCDPRPGLDRSCQLIGIRFDHEDEDVVPFDDRHATPQTPFWVRFHEGRRNHNRRLSACRDECTGNIYTATAMVGIMVYCHHPDIVKKGEHVLDLPGSVLREGRDNCACLKVWHGQPKLYVNRDDDVGPNFGSGCFRRE